MRSILDRWSQADVLANLTSTSGRRSFAAKGGAQPEDRDRSKTGPTKSKDCGADGANGSISGIVVQIAGYPDRDTVPLEAGVAAVAHAVKNGVLDPTISWHSER